MIHIMTNKYRMCEGITSLPPKMSARLLTDSRVSTSSAVRPVCQTGATYSNTGRMTAT